MISFWIVQITREKRRDGFGIGWDGFGLYLLWDWPVDRG